MEDPVDGRVISQHPGREVTPVLLELLQVPVEVLQGGVGTALGTAAGRGTIDTEALERRAATTLGPVEDTVEDTAAVATAVIVTEPQPLLVATPPARVLVTVGPRGTATTPPPATPRPGPLELRVCPDLEREAEAQSDPPPEIRDQTPTAEINDQSFIPTLGIL